MKKEGEKREKERKNFVDWVSFHNFASAIAPAGVDGGR